MKKSSESASGKIVKRRPPTTPTRGKRPTLVVMSPQALKLFAYRFYRLGFSDTGSGFHGEVFTRAKPHNMKALTSILVARFNRAYTEREE